jgi:hypothetical protein
MRGKTKRTKKTERMTIRGIEPVNDRLGAHQPDAPARYAQTSLARQAGVQKTSTARALEIP